MPCCIYTDTDVPDASGNWDHIVPLSLGGLDGFWTWSEITFNSDVGSKIDGAIANDPLIMLARRNADARGHSKKPPIPTWKHSTVDGQPVQIKLALDAISGWDPKARQPVPPDELEGREIAARLRIDPFASMRFAAKVSLGAAYFAYGDAITHAVDCAELRKLIALTPEQAQFDPRPVPQTLQVCDRFHPDATGSPPHGTAFRALCEFTGRSTVLLVPHDDAISFHLGVCGMFVASITAPANTRALPYEGPHDLGHAILLAPGRREHLSLRELTLALNDWMAAPGDCT